MQIMAIFYSIIYIKYPYMMRVGKMKVKVSFANNGVSIEEAFKNMLLTV